jgi:hypothetical protein
VAGNPSHCHAIYRSTACQHLRHVYNYNPVFLDVEKAHPSSLKYIIDMTIAYPNGEPLDLGVIVTGLRKPCNTHFHYKIYPIGTVSRLFLSYILILIQLYKFFFNAGTNRA